MTGFFDVDFDALPKPGPRRREVRFEPQLLVAAIDRRRRKLRISWREVARQVGERSTSGLSRLRRGGCPSADLLCRLMVWIGDTDISRYVTWIDEEPS